MRSTYTCTTKDAIAGRKWWLIDATGLTVGRLAAATARMLSGKNKPTWTPSVDTGDFVVIVNCEKVVLTGRKATDKLYSHYTGYPGGMKQVAAGKLLAERPVKVIETAIHGMLPKTRLGRAMARKLKVHAGPAHPHEAQRPEPVDLRTGREPRVAAT